MCICTCMHAHRPLCDAELEASREKGKKKYEQSYEKGVKLLTLLAAVTNRSTSLMAKAEESRAFKEVEVLSLDMES